VITFRKLKIPCGKPQGILMQGIIFYHIRSLDPAVNRREYARYPFKLLVIIFLAAIFPSCQKPLSQSDTKLRILTTTAPIYCFTLNIAGDAAVVENLLPSTVDPHEYALDPTDMRRIENADAVIKNGVNLEGWLDKIISSASKNITVVDTSLGIEIINNNPHIWLSPRNVIIQVKNIAEALAKIDPSHGNVYKGNAERYIQRLKTLNAEIQGEVGKLERKGFVAFHSAFLYFAKDYGLKQLAVIQESPEKEPSPKHIAAVINTIKAENMKAIFSETGITSKIVDTIAKDLNLQVYSLDTMEKGEIYPEWYEDRTRANLAVLKEVLK